MQFIFYLSLLAILYTPHDPINPVGNINACDSEIYVRNWEVTKPVLLDSGTDVQAISTFQDTLTRDQGDNLLSYADFSSLYNEPTNDTGRSEYTPFARCPYQLKGSFFPIDTYFHIAHRTSMLEPMVPAFAYTASIIRSSRDQDLLFITGANSGLKLWLNGRLVLCRFIAGYIQGYQYVAKVHLKKGDNFVLAKLLYTDGDWQFFLKMASLKYANENSLGENYSSICEHYLIKPGDSLNVKIWAPEIQVEKPSALRITDANGREVLAKRLAPGRNWLVGTKGFKEGIYEITLSTDEKTFKQFFFYGDYEKYFKSFKKWTGQVQGPEKFNVNTDVLISRMDYLNKVDVEHDNAYERKVTRVLYEMSAIYTHYKKGDELFTDVRGLHFRSHTSPFYSSDTYMIYIPETYRRASPVPLVIMIPAETGIREFNISTHVADINRVEHIMRLADKYGFAVLWSGFRVYNNHNLIRMLPDLVSKTLELVRKDYAIDDSRIYAYGDCAGGEQALFLANKYPSFFAAVGVEGPALADVDRADAPKFFNQEMINDNFCNTVINYHNFQTYIFHSINDEKSAFWKSAKLCKEISGAGGYAKLDTLYVRKGLDLFFTNLMPNNRILTDLFAFYNGKRKRTPDTVWLSTYQLKYNHAFWVTINDLVPGEKAQIIAMVHRAGNTINIQASNVKVFTLTTGDLKLDPGRKIAVNVNGRPYYNDYFKGENLAIDLQPSARQSTGSARSNSIIRPRKTETTEGPINDFFASPFLVVKGTNGTAANRTKWKNAIDTLRKGWQTDFLRDAIPCKTDAEITGKDAANYNLILIGADCNNPVLNRIWKQVPLKVYKDTVQLGRKNYTGKHLSYLFIYVNPYSPGKYVLVIGSNWASITSKALLDLSFQGWYDYEIYDRENRLDAGYFNNNWQ